MVWNETYSHQDIQAIQQLVMKSGNLGGDLSAFLTGNKRIWEGTSRYEDMRCHGERLETYQTWDGGYHQYFSVELFKTLRDMNYFVGRMDDVFSPFIKRQFKNLESGDYCDSATSFAETDLSQHVDLCCGKVLDVLRCVAGTNKENLSVKAVIDGFSSLSQRSPTSFTKGLLHLEAWKGQRLISPRLHAGIMEGLDRLSLTSDTELWERVAKEYRYTRQKSRTNALFDRVCREISNIAALAIVPEATKETLRCINLGLT